MHNTEIPAAWGSLEEFTQWYIDAGMPMMPPWDFETFRTDDASAIALFRKAPYQVEMYMIDNPVDVPFHEHPYVDVIQLWFDRSPSEDGNAKVGFLAPRLSLGQAHGAIAADDRIESNGMILTFEQWPEGVKPSTISAVWKGNVVGPLHEQLIKRFFPDAYVKDGYADITRKADA